MTLKNWWELPFNHTMFQNIPHISSLKIGNVKLELSYIQVSMVTYRDSSPLTVLHRYFITLQ